MGSVVGWTRTLLPSGDTETLEHRVFDPYGQIIRRSGPLGPDIPVGHQGLFHERLDYADNPSTSPRVFEPWARHLVLNRSRVYLPSHGRFAQQDPNATGATPVTSVGFHGATPWGSVDRIDLRAAFGDGLSIYQYVRSNPLQYSDPNGQFVFLLPLLKFGFAAYTAYSAGHTVVSAAQALQAGTIGTQQVLIGLAADLILSNPAGKGGKKLFDMLGGRDAAEKLIKRMKGKSGSALQRIRVSDHDWHHVFPKFLGGDPEGLLYLMPRELHQRFHGELYTKLIEKGIRKPGKGEKWEDMIGDDEKRRADSIEAVFEVSRKYDREHGTMLELALKSQLGMD